MLTHCFLFKIPRVFYANKLEWTFDVLQKSNEIVFYITFIHEYTHIYMFMNVFSACD